MFTHVFQPQVAAHISWLGALHYSGPCFYHLKPISPSESILSSSWTLTLLPPSYKDPYDYSEPQIVQDNVPISNILNLVTSITSLLPCEIT